MLRLRIITALVVLVIVLAVVVFLPPLAVVAVLAGLLLVGAWEWAGFLPTRNLAVRGAYVLVVGAIGVAAWRLVQSVSSVEGVLWFAAAWWTVALVWISAFPSRIGAVAVIVCGPFVLVPAGIALARLYLVSPEGPALLLFGLMIVWAADIGAYAVGRTVGRNKLAPRVSPGKTWEGVAGGLAGAAVLAAGGSYWFGLPLSKTLTLGVVVAAFSVVGDLTVSMFKRHAGVKDSGRLFPGHGGVLDRMDSITAAIPLFLLGLSWMGINA